MKFRIKAIAAALMLGAGTGVHAAIATGVDGDGELVLGMMDRTGSISYLRDLGIRKSAFLNDPVAGVTRPGTLFAFAPDALLGTFLSGAGSNPVQYFVMANDNEGARSFFTTVTTTSTGNLASNNVRNITLAAQNVLSASNSLGTHVGGNIGQNGSNTSTSGSAFLNAFQGTGNNYGGQATGIVSAALIGTPLYFFEVLGNSSGTAALTPRRFDSDASTAQGPLSEVLATWEFLTAPKEYDFINAQGVRVKQTFEANWLVYYMGGLPPEETVIPVPAALPLLLSGLGLFGLMARRRKA